MATTSRRTRMVVDHDHSPLILERRRKLFPADEVEVDSELGHISPLCSDNSDVESENIRQIADYDIVGIVQNIKAGSETPRSSTIPCNMSPLLLSPYSGTTTLKETPNKASPSYRLKTPHDTSSKSNTALKKEQKTLLEESKTMKRKSTPTESPKNTGCKYDSKNSKVRTALFPPENNLDMALPTKSFYSKNTENKLEKLSSRDKHIVKPARQTAPRYNYRPNRKYGQINNGVSHKIKKPKQRAVSKKVLEKMTKKFLQTGTALTEYIQDLSELRKSQNSDLKLINIEKSQTNNVNLSNNEKSQLQHSSPDNDNQDQPKPVLVASGNKENISPPVSPIKSCGDDDKTRRFFKSSRGKLKCAPEIQQSNKTVDDFDKTKPEKYVLPTSQQHDKIQFDTSDFQDDEQNSTTNIDNILCTLENDSPHKLENPLNSLSHDPAELNVFTPNRIILQAHTSISASENSIQLHQRDVANMILSPISQMCDVTSGLALDSPKKARNLAAVFDSMPNRSELDPNRSSSVDMEQKAKLFPIFCGEAQQPARGEKRERSEIKRNVKRFKALSPDQMLLDAGQKKFGLTLCNECNIVYHLGDPGDEIVHLNYHNSTQILRFSGWKNERVVGDFQKSGRIIKVCPTDSKIWLKKVNDLMSVVKRDLGSYEMDHDLSNSQIYLYIKNHTIAGCAVATVPKEPGHKMLSTLNNIAMCSEETYPIKCGISHIWVHTSFRKQGVATALLNSVKSNFLYGYILSNHDIALTSPTEAGSAFAERYFKSPNFLIYYV